MRQSAAGVAGLFFLLGSCHREVAPVAGASLTPVKTERLEWEAVTGEMAYTANIAPETQVNLAFRVGGYVEQLLAVGERRVQEGDVVTAGTVLASLRQADFSTRVGLARAQQEQARAALAVARAQLAEARVSVDDATRDLQRARNLFAVQSLTRPELDKAEARRSGAQARLAAAEGQVQAGEAQLGGSGQGVREAELASADASLRAPMGGVILKKMVEVGSLAAPGVPVFVLANTATVKAVFGIPDSLIGELRRGQPLRVEAEGVPGREFQGRITNIAASADPKSRVFDVDVAIPNHAGQLRIGMIATVRMGGATAPVLVAPLRAVVRSRRNPDRYAVFVVEEAGGRMVARQREIEVGKTLNNGVSILGGVTRGTLVVTAGSSQLSDGETVQVVP